MSITRKAERFRLTASPVAPSAIEPVDGSPAEFIKAKFPTLADASSPHLSMQASTFVDWRRNVVCNVNTVLFDMY